MSKTRRLLEILTEDQVRQIHFAALRVLEEVGLWLPNREVLELLHDAGAYVDFTTQIARMPPWLVENSIDKCPSRFTWHARNPARSLDMNGLDTHFGSPAAAIHVIDLDGNRRLGTIADGEEICRLCDALPNLGTVGTGVDPSDMPLAVLETWYLMTVYTHSSKPVLARAYSADYALPMSEVVADTCGLPRDQLPLVAGVNTVSPLYNTPDQLAGVLKYIRRRVPIIIAPEIQAGATGPATLAGTLAQATAEFLSHVTVCQLLSPGIPLAYGAVSSAFDMRTMILPYGAPEADLIGIATAQLARYYGVPSRATGGASDANALGMQAGVESVMSNLLPLMAGCSYVQHAAGELENTLAISYEKIVIDDEIIGMARRLARGMEVTPETLAFDAIKEVGPRGNFLGTEHTHRHFRREQFMPALLGRDKYDVWDAAGRKRVEEHARDRVRKILVTHEPEPLPDEALKEIKAIYVSARRSAGME